MQTPRPLLVGMGLALAVGSCGQPLDVLPETLPKAVEGTEYSQELYTEQSASATWSVVHGGLPDGLRLTEAGKLTGTPREAGTFQFTVHAVGSSAAGQGDRDYVLEVAEQLVLTDLTLAAARINQPYADAVGASGGLPPYTYTAQNLPAGISFNEETGEVTGTPLQIMSGERWLITATDSDTPPQTTSGYATFRVKDVGAEITTVSLPDATIGSGNYSAQLAADHGVPPYQWSVIAGYLGTLNLQLDPATGRITSQAGKTVPPGAVDLTITVQVTDSDAPSSENSATFTIHVVPAP